MKITYTLEAQERKSLVKAIALRTELMPEYLGMPSAAYRIGELHIDKAGTITGPDDRGLIGLLREFHSFVPASEEYDRPDTFHLITPRGTLLIQEHFATAAEAKAEGYGIAFHHEGRDVFMKPAPDGLSEHSKHFAVVGVPFTEEDRLKGPTELAEEEVDGVVIEVPLGGFTPEAIDNLSKMVIAKEALLKKALGTDNLPIQVLDDRIAFPWFASTDSAEVDAYAQFITALCETAKAKKRVNAKAPEGGFENEAFAMRVWLIGLGLVGSEFKLARKLLGRGLSGSTSWRYGAPEKAEAEEGKAHD